MRKTSSSSCGLVGRPHRASRCYRGLLSFGPSCSRTAASIPAFPPNAINRRGPPSLQWKVHSHGCQYARAAEVKFAPRGGTYGTTAIATCPCAWSARSALKSVEAIALSSRLVVENHSHLSRGSGSATVAKGCRLLDPAPLREGSGPSYDALRLCVSCGGVTWLSRGGHSRSHQPT